MLSGTDNRERVRKVIVSGLAGARRKGRKIRMTEKRILVISNFACYPPDKGNRRRIYNMLRLMKSLGNTVDFLYFSSEKSADEKTMRAFLGKENYFFCKVKKEKDSIFYKYGKGFPLGRFFPPNRIDVKYLAEVNKKAEHLLEQHKYDIVWLEYPFQSKILENMNASVVKVIDTHDSFAYRNYKIFPFTHEAADYSITFHGERRALSRADFVIAIQEQEGRYFKKLLRGTGTKVAVIGDSHDLVKNEVAGNRDVVFVGGANGLNLDAVNWFISNVFPMVIKKVKDCRLIVAGSVCKMSGIKRGENVKLLGPVEDLDDLYRNCRLVVNPVRMGTGLNIKSIEAIAHCKPLVATSIGAKGLAGNPAVVAVADDNTEFAREVICFLENDSRCKKYRNSCIQFMDTYNRHNSETMNKVLSYGKKNKQK